MRDVVEERMERNERKYLEIIIFEVGSDRWWTGQVKEKKN